MAGFQFPAQGRPFHAANLILFPSRRNLARLCIGAMKAKLHGFSSVGMDLGPHFPVNATPESNPLHHNLREGYIKRKKGGCKEVVNP
jgi:hypothetical protein